MSIVAFGCQECGHEDALARFTVWAPVNDTYTIDPFVNVCADCVSPAEDRMANHPDATGLPQVDPLSYLDGAA